VGGKCRYCRKPLDHTMPLVELLTGFVFVAVWLLPIPEVERFTYMGIVSTLTVIFFADVKYHLIPDSMHVVLFLLLSFLFLQWGFAEHQYRLRFAEGVAVMLPILLLYLLTRGRGMGFGDVKFAFIMGYGLGMVGGVIALYLAFVTGAVVGSILLLTKNRRLGQHIAFGPFLVLGFLTMLFYGGPVIRLFKTIYPM
jgi:prepilin signal peptidase PulO-like enzyme (type II secretory pathway)